jgi:hypothetical protein
VREEGERGGGGKRKKRERGRFRGRKIIIIIALPVAEQLYTKYFISTLSHLTLLTSV